MPAGRDLPFSCRCGAVRGRLLGMAPSTTNRVVCSCAGCRGYLPTLGRADLLDAHDGSDIVQTSPRRVVVDEGAQHLACRRMTPRGVLRFYAACCDTPVANTMDRRAAAFVGLHHRALCALSEEEREAAFGPIRVRVNGEYAPDEARALRARPIDLLPMFARFAPRFFGWVLRGDGRHSPFFTEDGAPIRGPVLWEG